MTGGGAKQNPFSLDISGQLDSLCRVVLSAISECGILDNDGLDRVAQHSGVSRPSILSIMAIVRQQSVKNGTLQNAGKLLDLLASAPNPEAGKHIQLVTTALGTGLIYKGALLSVAPSNGEGYNTMLGIAEALARIEGLQITVSNSLEDDRPWNTVVKEVVESAALLNSADSTISH